MSDNVQGSRYRSSEEEILQAMESYGGSFVKQFARLYRLGDFQNRVKLEKACREYFEQYDQLVQMHKQRRGLTE